MINKSLMLSSFFALSACGVVYTSPSVKKASGLVNVVNVTFQTIAVANKDPFTPKKLPADFNNVSVASVPKSMESLQHELSPDTQHAQTALPLHHKPRPYKLGISDIVILTTAPLPGTATLETLMATQDKRHGHSIQDDGAVSIAGLGRIKLSGLTLEDAEEVIFQAFVKAQLEPKFSLDIVGFNSKTVSVGGSVNMPKVIPITLKPLTIQNAMQSAGGITSATPEQTIIHLSRNNKKYRFSFNELRSHPGLQNLVLQDGDNIYVDDGFQKRLALLDEKSQALAEIQLKNTIKSERSEEARQNFLTRLELGAVKRDYVFLAGEVARQGRFALPFDNTASVADAIYSKSGIKSREGNVRQIYILRASKSEKPITAFHLDAKNAINLVLATKMELRPNDILFVAEQHVTAWNRVISQILPTFNVANLADLVAE